MRMSIKDKIWAALFRRDFLHSLIGSDQAFNWLDPANIGIAIATCENVVDMNHWSLVGCVHLEGARQPPLSQRRLERLLLEKRCSCRASGTPITVDFPRLQQFWLGMLRLYSSRQILSCLWNALGVTSTTSLHKLRSRIILTRPRLFLRVFLMQTGRPLVPSVHDDDLRCFLVA